MKAYAETFVCYTIFKASREYIFLSSYIYATASEQTDKRKHRKIEKIKMRHSRESAALTLPWHVLIFSILAPYGLLSASPFCSLLAIVLLPTFVIKMPLL